MTITFDTTKTVYDFYLNGQFSFADRIEFRSMYSNTPLFDLPATIITANTRYTQLEFTMPSDLNEKHIEGIYEYIVYGNGVLIDTGVVKVITQPGGSTGTEPYISTNEDREAKVYFRSSYE